MIARGALLLAMVGCHDPAHVTVVAAATSCGLPASGDLQGLKLHAYAPSGEVIESIASTAGAVELADLPADTVQLGVEVFGENSATLLQGKSGPLVFDQLGNGDTIAIFMAPPDGTCPTGPLSEARQAPLVARAGDGAIVVGGIGSAGPLATAEYFDPASGEFAPVDVPPELADETNGLAGFVLTTMPDGRVVMTGGARYLSIFDPAKTPLAFTSPQVFANEQRSFHAAIALDADHLMLAAGCTDVTAQACGGLFLTNTRIYALDDLGHPVLGPMLSVGSQHASPHLFDLGTQTDGRSVYVLAGGDVVPGLGGDPLVGERFELDDAASTSLAIQAQPAALDGGAVLTAFAPDGMPTSGKVAVVVPDGEIASMSDGPSQGGSRLVALEDGTVAGLGGDPTGAIHIYIPTTSTWKTVGAAPVLDAPAALLLGDGSVLAIDGAAPTAQAWRYRPSLIGASSGTVAASFPTMGTQDTVLVAPDPRPVAHTTGYELTAMDDSLSARALVGGPRMATGSVQVSARVDGGIALIGQQLGPGRALVGHLVTGAPGRIDRIHDGTISTLCEGQVPAFPGGNVAIDVALTVTAQSATLSLAHETVASCALDSLGGDAGAWGMAPDGAAAKITVFTVTATRNTQQQ